MTKYIMILAAMMMFAACDGGGDDGNDETPQNDNDTAGCTGCHAWDTCVGNTCVFNATSQWDITAVSGQITENNGSLPWDTLDDPDGLICVTINGQESCTEADVDTFYPDWHQKLFENAGGGQIMGGIYIEYWDLDITLEDSENICAGTLTVEDSYFDGGGFAILCDDGVSTASFTLTYQP